MDKTKILIDFVTTQHSYSFLKKEFYGPFSTDWIEMFQPCRVIQWDILLSGPILKNKEMFVV